MQIFDSCFHLTLFWKKNWNSLSMEINERAQFSCSEVFLLQQQTNFTKNLETVTIYGQNASLFYFFNIFITHIPTFTYVCHYNTVEHISTKNGKRILHGLNFFFRIYAFQYKSFISSITLEWHLKKKKQVQKNVLKVL